MVRHVLVTALFVGAFGCGYPSIGEEPDIKLPERQVKDPATDDENDKANEEEQKTTASDVTLNVTLLGEGDVTSEPAGLTCTGKTCTGKFKKGTAVTLTPTPKAGSLFQEWSGGCLGAQCAPTLNEDFTATAQFPMLDGNWTGTYTNTRPNAGCTFNNAGNLNVTFSTAATTTSTNANCTGLEIRNLNGCGLVDKRDGTAPSSTATVDSAKREITGTWTMSIPGINGTLAFPFKGTLDGTKLTGSWTCPNCSGSFTLNRAP